jgi:hypothetical protein
MARSCTIPPVAVARPRTRPAPVALGWEAQLDQDVEERALAGYLDALRTLAEWSATDEVARRVPIELRWRAVELLDLLVDAGKAEKAVARWRGAGDRVLWKAR